MNLELIEKKFNEYVATFDSTNYDIAYKKLHSYRVMHLCRRLAQENCLSSIEIDLSTVIGLLHDVGRFEQIKRYNNMSDKNIDHADLSVKILFEDNLIEQFNIDKKYYEVIKFAIKNHNKLYIENDKSNEKMFFAQIIRDADKIDILRAFSIYREYVTQQIEAPISEKVANSFFNNECVKKEDIKNKNDIILFRLAFLFDMNFSESLKIIDQDNILEYYEKNIATNPVFKPYLEHIKLYVKENKNYVR